MTFAVSRRFEAPRKRIWDAWTKPDELAAWWGPKGVPVSVLALDLKPSGVFHYRMEMPGGAGIGGRFVYREIKAPARLVFTSGFADDNGRAMRNPWSATWPLEVLNTLTLEAQDGGTLLTLRGDPLDATALEQQTFLAAVPVVQQAMAATLDQLGAHIARS